MQSVTYTCFTGDEGGPFYLLENLRATNISGTTHIMTAGRANFRFKTNVIPTPSLFVSSNLLPQEEILLGVLSLIVISLLTSLVYDLLLRVKRNGSYSSSALSIAVALESIERWGLNSRTVVGISSKRRTSVWWRGLFIVFSLAVVTFSLEVGLIVATQESDSFVSGQVLGFSLVSPVVTNWGMGQFLRRNAPARPCVTTNLIAENADWKALVQTCFRVNYTDERPAPVFYNGNVTLKSVYHSRGAQHLVMIPSLDLYYSLSATAKIYGQNVHKGPLEIRRRSVENETETALTVHLTAPIYYETNTLRNNSLPCPADPVKYDYTHERSRETVAVGQKEGDTIYEESTVYTTTFQVETDDAEWWMVQSLGSAAAAAGISLIEKPTYIRGKNNRDVVFKEDILGQRIRHCNLITMSIILGFLVVVKLGVKRWLRPLSLYEVARIKNLEAAGIAKTHGLLDSPDEEMRVGFYRGNGMDSAHYGVIKAEHVEISYEEAKHMYVD